MATIAQWRELASGDSETLHPEAEDKGLDSNSHVETLHVELQYRGNGRTIEEWQLSHCESIGTYWRVETIASE